MDPELEETIMKAVNKFFDYEYEPGKPTSKSWEHWEHVDVGSELDDFFSNLALPPIDALTSPPHFSLSFDASVPLTRPDFPQFCETDTQTASPDFSSRSDAYNDFHEDVLSLGPGEGDTDASFYAYTPPLPSPTPSQYSLPTFTEAARYYAPAPEPQYLLSSHYSQSSTSVIAPSVANSANPAANQRTGMPFASWNKELSYPPPHRPAALPTQPFIIPPPPGATYLNAEESESFSHFRGEMLSAHPKQQQSQGSIQIIHPIRTSGQVRDHSTPYEWPQVDDGSEYGKENNQTPGPLVSLQEIPIPSGKSKFTLTLIDDLEAKYPRIDPSAFYFFMDTPSEFNCPALGCTAVLKIHEISGHRDSHVLPNGRVTVSNGSGGSKSIEADSFRKKVTDGAGCQHTCPYCNRSLTRCEQYHLRRHLVACQSLKQQAAKALEAFASRGN